MDLRTTILPYRDRLYRLALSITQHTAEAEDIVQDTMLRAWEQRNEWPNIKNIGAWLAQICKNLSLDHKKRADLLRTVDLPSETETATSRQELAQLQQTTPDKQVEASETMNLLSRLMAELPPPQNDIIRLRELEGLSYKEIAEELQLTETQVRVYLHRARTRIKQQYLQWH